MGYKKVPDGLDFSTRFPSYILAYCPDTCSWFATNQRFFFYEYEKEFPDEQSAIDYFRQNARLFYEIETGMGIQRPSFCKRRLYIDNTDETIEVDEQK